MPPDVGSPARVSTERITRGGLAAKSPGRGVKTNGEVALPVRVCVTDQRIWCCLQEQFEVQL